MTFGGQSRKDAPNPIADLLSPKRKLNVSCWNVRTLYQTGKLAQVQREMLNYKIDLLGISEARWTGAGKRQLSNGDMIVWSGRDDNQHRQGVALLIAKQNNKSLLEWKPINERILYTRHSSKYTKLSILTCYAPTEDADEDNKEEFFDTLRMAVESIPRHDMLMIIGDLNARVGNKAEEIKAVGKEGVGTINDNGSRLVEFCEEHNLCIGGTFFPHKNIHKMTWKSPDGKTESQIDHIIINRKWKGSLNDVRVRRLADIGSDHQLVTAKISIKLRKVRIADMKKQRFNVEKLKSPDIQNQFNISVKNKFSILQDISNMTIQDFNHVMQETATEQLGYKKSNSDNWISVRSWELINERKAIKQHLLNAKSPRLKERLSKEYSLKDKEVKKSTRTDKRDYTENLATEAEDAAERQDSQTLYKITKMLSGNRNFDQEKPLKSQDGSVITDEKAKIERWRQYFTNLLNRPDPSAYTDIPEAETDIEVNLGPITEQEVHDAIKQQRNGKAPGIDRISAEMLKSNPQEMSKILSKLFTNILEKEEIPEDWQKGIIHKIPKKGDLGNCANWRGITLLSVTNKIFNRILLKRLTPHIEKILRKEQAGFRKGRSCNDHIFTIRQILEQSIEWNSPLYVVFVDFEKAFDSLHRESLWKILRHYGIPIKMVNLIKAMYNNFQCQVICGNNLTNDFKVTTGVKQGCILSPLLFILALDWLMKTTVVEKKRGIRWTLTSFLEDIDYADDIALVSSTHTDATEKLNTLHRNASKIGLKINFNKTVHMRINPKYDRDIRVDEQSIEEVQEFLYLGSKITNDGNSEHDIRHRIQKANQAFGMLRNFWKSNKISRKTKLKIYKSNIVSVLLYGSECWKMTSTITKKLETFQNKCLKRIFRIFWPTKITTTELLRKADCTSIENQVRRRRWRWLGHVARMEKGSLPKTALYWTADGKRRRGRPKETWRRSMEKEIKEAGLSWNTATTKAADRREWRCLVDALCAPRPDGD